MKLLYKKETYLIRGVCFKVWKKFGGAFKEKIIEGALIIELEKHGLKVSRQPRITIYYDEKAVGTYVPDLVINNKILIELKARPTLTKEDERQFWYYLKGTKYRLGLLINFGNKLEIKRRIYDKAREKFQPSSASSSA